MPISTMAKVGESLVTLDVADDAATGEVPPAPAKSMPSPPPSPEQPPSQPERSEKVQATPAVRRLCREHNL
ncbi:hypothetical protein BVRB_034470, partial [Beta vulgaris subsp. vulgaris]